MELCTINFLQNGFVKWREGYVALNSTKQNRLFIEQALTYKKVDLICLISIKDQFLGSQ